MRSHFVFNSSPCPLIQDVEGFIFEIIEVERCFLFQSVIVGEHISIINTDCSHLCRERMSAVVPRHNYIDRCSFPFPLFCRFPWRHTFESFDIHKPQSLSHKSSNREGAVMMFGVTYYVISNDCAGHGVRDTLCM